MAHRRGCDVLHGCQCIRLQIVAGHDWRPDRERRPCHRALQRRKHDRLVGGELHLQVGTVGHAHAHLDRVHLVLRVQIPSARDPQQGKVGRRPPHQTAVADLQPAHTRPRLDTAGVGKVDLDVIRERAIKPPLGPRGWVDHRRPGHHVRLEEIDQPHRYWLRRRAARAGERQCRGDDRERRRGPHRVLLERNGMAQQRVTHCGWPCKGGRRRPSVRGVAPAVADRCDG